MFLKSCFKFPITLTNVVKTDTHHKLLEKLFVILQYLGCTKLEEKGQSLESSYVTDLFPLILQNLYQLYLF